MNVPNDIKSSALAGLLFFVIANPVTYGITHNLLSKLLPVQLVNELGTPTQLGTAVHALVFGLITLLLMRLAARSRALSKVTGYDSV